MARIPLKAGILGSLRVISLVLGVGGGSTGILGRENVILSISCLPRKGKCMAVLTKSNNK